MVEFTDREMFRAWRNNYDAYRSAEIRTNAHRLLLFYAVECGLKALILKHCAKTHTGECIQATSHKHNINGLLDQLRAGAELRIRPEEIEMCHIRTGNVSRPRRALTKEINQVWRYGGNGVTPNDSDVAVKLEKIAEWIRGEVQ